MWIYVCKAKMLAVREDMLWQAIKKPINSGCSKMLTCKARETM
jgi:hypothetical protein